MKETVDSQTVPYRTSFHILFIIYGRNIYRLLWAGISGLGGLMFTAFVVVVIKYIFEFVKHKILFWCLNQNARI